MNLRTIKYCIKGTFGSSITPRTHIVLRSAKCLTFQMPLKNRVHVHKHHKVCLTFEETFKFQTSYTWCQLSFIESIN